MKKGQIRAYGTEIIPELFKKYNIALAPIGNYGIEEMQADMDKFSNFLKRIPSEYVAKQNYEILKKKYDELLKQAQHSYIPYWEDKFERYKQQMEVTCRNTLNNQRAEFRTEKCELESQIQELENKVKKWQAMYTGQAEANAILVRKLEEVHND